MKSKPKRKQGRSATPIDLKQLEELAALYCTDEELAAHFNLGKRQFERRKEDPAVREAWERGRGLGRVSLRRAQFAAAINGDRTMLCFLGKNILHQRSEPKDDGETRQPKQVIPDWLADDYRTQGVIEQPKRDEPEGVLDPNAAKGAGKAAVH
ncbi:MAG: hypothetical protein NVS9B4_00550 [Candidatus Acidiferrum sp.]